MKDFYLLHISTILHVNVITTENIVKCSESYLTNLPLDHSLIAAAMSGTVMYAVLNTLLDLLHKFAIECIVFISF